MTGDNLKSSKFIGDCPICGEPPGKGSYFDTEIECPSCNSRWEAEGKIIQKWTLVESEQKPEWVGEEHTRAVWKDLESGEDLKISVESKREEFREVFDIIPGIGSRKIIQKLGLVESEQKPEQVGEEQDLESGEDLETSVESKNEGFRKRFNKIPGINGENTTRRNVVTGSGYALVVLVTIGLFGDEDSSSEDSGGGGSSSEDSGGGSSSEDNCQEVLSFQGYERNSARFNIEEGQYIEITVEHKAGIRTRGVLNYNYEAPFGESVLEEGTKVTGRVPDDPEKLIQERTGEWIARYEPSSSEQSTYGSVTVKVCSPDSSQ